MNSLIPRGLTLRGTLLVAVTTTALFLAPAPTSAKQLSQLLMILDASISMEDRLGSELKYKLVRKAMSKALPAYGGKLQTGLITFGRNSKSSCKDISRLVKLKPLKPKAFATVINNIKPKGKSPIGASLAAAADMAKITSNTVQMLLIADGSDNCSANICATANLIAKHSPQTKVHVIGVGKPAIVNQLACISKATKGTFTAVDSSSKMTTVLNLILQTAALGDQPAKPTMAVLARPPLPNPRPGQKGATDQPATQQSARFPKTVPLPTRPSSRHKTTPPPAAADEQIEKLEQQLAVVQPPIPEQPAPNPVPASEAAPVPIPQSQPEGIPPSDQRLTSGNRPETPAEVTAPKNSDSALWQSIPDQSTIVAKATPSVAQPPEPVEIPPSKPATTPPNTTFQGPQPSIEITLPVTSAKVKLGALITEQGKPIQSGLFWRIYKSKKEEDGSYKLVKSLEAPQFDDTLPLGVYLVNLSWGRSHLTEKLDILSSKPYTHNYILNAGGLRLGARHLDGSVLPASQVVYRIYSDERDQFGKRRLILDQAKPARTIRLNAGIYHIASLYGTANGLIETDITIEAGKLTEAVINHSASKVTFKLVDTPGGEALAGAVWRISSPDGALVKNTGGALPSLILAAGDYIINATYAGRTYARKVSIERGAPVNVEIVIQ